MPPRIVNLCFGKSALSKEEQKAEYRRKYRESKSGFVDCECGVRVRELCVYSHRFSRRHLEFIKTGEIQPVNVEAAVRNYQSVIRAKKAWYQRGKEEHERITTGNVPIDSDVKEKEE
jgi:hypothetical protein